LQLFFASSQHARALILRLALAGELGLEDLLLFDASGILCHVRIDLPLPFLNFSSSTVDRFL